VIEFEPLREDDLPLVRDWLGREHVRRWWRDPIEEAIDKRRQGIEEGRTDQYLILVDGRPASSRPTSSPTAPTGRPSSAPSPASQASTY